MICMTTLARAITSVTGNQTTVVSDTCLIAKESNGFRHHMTLRSDKCALTHREEYNGKFQSSELDDLDVKEILIVSFGMLDGNKTFECYTDMLPKVLEPAQYGVMYRKIIRDNGYMADDARMWNDRAFCEYVVELALEDRNYNEMFSVDWDFYDKIAHRVSLQGLGVMLVR